MITIQAAKKIVQSFLTLHNLDYRLTAKTVGFMDLTRGRSIFVKVHGWKPSPLWDELEALAHQHHFCVETSGNVFFAE